MLPRFLVLPVVAAATFFGPLLADSQAQTATELAAPSARVSCSVRTAPLTPGEVALDGESYAKAEPLLLEESKAAGESGERAHNEWIRTLLSEDKLDQAQTEAQKWLTLAPEDGWAKMTVAEVQWRKGDVEGAMRGFDGASKALPCNARIRADYARVYEFSGLNATAKHNLDVAHKLDPISGEITRAWLQLQVNTPRVEATTNSSDTSKSASTHTEAAPAKASAEPAQTAPCRAVGSVTSTSVEYRRIQDGAHAAIYDGLVVSFNGTPRRLEIDTGAHGLMLTRSAADALHLPVEGRGRLGGIGDEGSVGSHLSTVKSVKVGNLEFQNCRVEVLDQTTKLGSSDGLIGGDVFAEFLLTLDFPGHRLRLDPLPPLPGATPEQSAPSLETGVGGENAVRDRYVAPSMQDWAKVFRSGHLLVMPVRINEGPVRLFVVDSGSESNLISPAVARQVGSVYSGSEMRVIGISGEVGKVSTTGPLKLDFAGLRYPSPGMTAIDTSKVGTSAGIEIAGFLGAPTLHQLTVQIDYRDDLMHFSFDPKRLQHCASGVNISDCY